jgi:hypothetical protein
MDPRHPIGDAVLVLMAMLERTTRGLRRHVLAARLRRVEQERRRLGRLPPPASRASALVRAHRLESLCVQCVRLRYRVARLQPTGPGPARLAPGPGRSAP